MRQAIFLAPEVGGRVERGALLLGALPESPSFHGPQLSWPQTAAEVAAQLIETSRALQALEAGDRQLAG